MNEGILATVVAAVLPKLEGQEKENPLPHRRPSTDEDDAQEEEELQMIFEKEKNLSHQCKGQKEKLLHGFLTKRCFLLSSPLPSIT